MNRRKFLALSAGVSLATGLPEAHAEHSASQPIIDTHIHLFDTRRTQGVPWPDKC